MGLCPASLGQASFEPDAEVGSIRGTAVTETGHVPALMLLTVYRRGKLPDSDSSGWLSLGLGKPLQSDGGCEGKIRVDQV